MELAGKKALVTGGAVRVGRAISRSLARAGCDLVIHYHRSDDAALDLQRELEQEGLRCTTLQADLGEPQECQELLGRATEASGSPRGIELLINNAAIFPLERLAETGLESWDRQMAVNLRAPFLLSRELVRQLSSGGQGRIVNITDARVGRSVGGPFAYQLAKAALEEMTRLLAVELAPEVTVNAVAPGAALAPEGVARGEFLQRVRERVPLGRPGGARSVADAVLHLLAADFTTGAILRVDGGEYL